MRCPTCGSIAEAVAGCCPVCRRPNLPDGPVKGGEGAVSFDAPWTDVPSVNDTLRIVRRTRREPTPPPRQSPLAGP
jgi:hypothetical protein